MLYILFTTGQCNLKCRYCGGSLPTNLLPLNIKYSISHLKRFIADDSQPIIAFYGGEPLLNVKFIRQIIKNFSDISKFVIQSNGIPNRTLGQEYWLKFDTVLLSIDGRRKVTNYYRGSNVYGKVIDCAKWLRTIGFKNDLIARMTVSEFSDIYLDVKDLLSMNLFDHIHWQLDVVWSPRWKNFSEWCESYMHGISKLVRLWIEKARKGIILGIVPFITILNTMIKNGRIGCPPCGAGVNSLSILTNGNVVACPIAMDVKWAKLGNVLKDSKARMVNKVKITKPCISCDYLRYCGGRCLYTHYEQLWGEEGFNKICKITIHTIKELAKVKDEVLSLLNRNVISIQQLNYPSFNNTTEIIP